MQKPVFSVIVPCYNEQEVLSATHERLKKVMEGLKEPYEIIYINDCSKDETFNILNELERNDESVKVVHLAKNTGHQVAVSCGLDVSSGDAVVIIDADLQDPPEVIPQMVEKWREGYEVVYGQRLKRDGESFFKKFTAKVYYRLMTKLAGKNFPVDAGDFRLVDRKAVDVICSMREHSRYLRGMFSWMGFRQAPVQFHRHERFAGETKYPLKKMLKLAFDGIIGFSNKPLLLPLTLGLSFMFIAFILFIILMFAVFSGGSTLLLTISTLGFFLSASVLICLGIVGAYIARIHEESQNRPLYIIGEKRGF